ncbi:MAG TPA: RNA polymerase sigma factor [Thermoanaerobaculia bacterium]|jgi:RNA polymerase sigma-70 factor (ECF subfamily)|nr:RNA polymerase sigma factor [Thermoanaerobaculia bacterium]
MAAEVLRMIPTKESVEPDDRQLVEQIRQGDDGAFETLVRRKTSKVYGLCYRVIGNGEDAKDISQLVFLKLWENLEKYDSAYAFDTWLYRMVTNVAIDFMRNKQSRDNAVNSNLRLVKTSVDPEQTVTVQRKEVESVFNVVSGVLSPKQKTIFVMSEMEDLRSSEIARILGCRESTVRNHLFNARKLMQQQLKKRFPEYARLWEESR